MKRRRIRGHRLIPTRDALLRSRILAPLAHRLTDPSLWAFRRHGVARGVALGLFFGLLVPLGQTPVAAIFAVPLRANLPVTAAATLITNPFTFPFIYFAAHAVGSWVLGLGGGVDAGGVEAGLWLLGAAGKTFVGLAIFAVIAAPCGYVITHLAWRLHIIRQWNARLKNQNKTYT